MLTSSVYRPEFWMTDVQHLAIGQFHVTNSRTINSKPNNNLLL